MKKSVTILSFVIISLTITLNANALDLEAKSLVGSYKLTQWKYLTYPWLTPSEQTRDLLVENYCPEQLHLKIDEQTKTMTSEERVRSQVLPASELPLLVNFPIDSNKRYMEDGRGPIDNFYGHLRTTYNEHSVEYRNDGHQTNIPLIKHLGAFYSRLEHYKIIRKADDSIEIHALPPASSYIYAQCRYSRE